MKKKHPKALTATRVRYRVVISGQGTFKPGVRSFPKKEQTIRFAKRLVKKNNKPVYIDDMMAGIGKPLTWIVTTSGGVFLSERRWT